jgi:hypothetical protein
LLKAAKHNANIHILELLLKNGAKPDKTDIDGNTPLHYAAMRGTVEVAQFLMQNGSNTIYNMNKQGLVPYEVCTRSEVVKEFMICPVSGKPGHIKCKQCNVVVYCSTACQQKNYVHHHKKLCGILERRGKQQ